MARKVHGANALEMLVEVAWVNAQEPTDAAALPPGCGLRFAELEDDVGQHVAWLIDEYQVAS